jgi:hypothetical protein
MTIPHLQYAAPQPAQAPPKGKGFAITALVLGIVALIFSWVPVFGLILGALAVVFGVVGLLKSSRPMSIVGLVLGSLAMLINIIILAAAAAAVKDVTAPSGPALSTVEPTTAAATTEQTTAPPTAEETTDSATTEPAAPPAPAYRTPKASDFLLTVKNTSKKCFGSAGCLIDYKVKVALSNSVNLDPDKSYEVTFDIKGDESGPITGSFTVEDGSYSGSDLEGSASTASSSKKLTAKVTDIEEA